MCKALCGHVHVRGGHIVWAHAKQCVDLVWARSRQGRTTPNKHVNVWTLCGHIVSSTRLHIGRFRRSLRGCMSMRAGVGALGQHVQQSVCMRAGVEGLH
eukprot:355425-Chlamydomonas_euryale.AAC.5